MDHWRNIERLAGIVGIGDIGNLTYRELLERAEGKQNETWQHTSSLMALIANANRSSKRTTPFVPADFNPFEKKRRKKQGLSVSAANIDLVANIICGGRDGE